jgi:hypothetical protein
MWRASSCIKACIYVSFVFVGVAGTYVAESADFVVRAALGVEIAATLGTTHGNTSQSILEDL